MSPHKPCRSYHIIIHKERCIQHDFEVGFALVLRRHYWMDLAVVFETLFETGHDDFKWKSFCFDTIPSRLDLLEEPMALTYYSAKDGTVTRPSIRRLPCSSLSRMMEYARFSFGKSIVVSDLRFVVSRSWWREINYSTYSRVTIG